MQMYIYGEGYIYKIWIPANFPMCIKWLNCVYIKLIYTLTTILHVWALVTHTEYISDIR